MRPTRPAKAVILAAARAPAMLVSHPVNIRYLTGVSTDAGFLLLTPHAVVLYANMLFAKAGHPTTLPFRTRDISCFAADTKTLRGCAYEAQHVTIAVLQRWEKSFPDIRFQPRSDIIETFRRAKYDDELRMIRRACSITKRVLARAADILKTGVTESDVAWKLADFAHVAGADGMAFETIVAFGEHTALPHHRPTRRRLQKGDIVQVDMGVRFGGYCSDYSRVSFTTPPSAEQRIAFTALRKAKYAAQSLVRSGVSSCLLDSTARAELKKYEYESEFCHSLGHGVGLEIHEGVGISEKAAPTPLLKNEVITIEPGVYFPGKWGMRIEDTVIVNG